MLVLMGIYVPLAQFWVNLSDIVALAGVLAVSYGRVLRLNRPLLRLLWQYSFVSLAISLIFSVVDAILLYPEDLTAFQLDFRTSLTVLLSIPVHMVALVWFARKASRGGFKYALVLLGLIAHAELTPFSLLDAVGSFVIWRGELYFGGIIFTAILALVAVWVLHQADSGGVVTKRAIATLFSVALLGLLGYEAFYLVQSLTYWDAPEWSLAVQASAYVSAGAVFQYVLPGGLAYLVRVREIDLCFVPGEDPPPDEGEEPPRDEGDEDFVGLYSRRVGPTQQKSFGTPFRKRP